MLWILPPKRFRHTSAIPFARRPSQNCVLENKHRALVQGNRQRTAIGILCAATLCGILVACLWPFHSPRNEVHWLQNRNGLRFDHYGTVVSSGQFELGSSDKSPCSLEIWMKPARIWGTGTLVDFYNGGNRRQFSLQQNFTDLALQREFGDENRQTNLSVANVFWKKEALITVTSDGQATAVYVDGTLLTRSPRFGLSFNDFKGQLILATSPLQSNSWSGELLGLAIYNSELSTEQVVQHY
jgi:concanavalin A-like lectin/glucanase superfamily protein